MEQNNTTQSEVKRYEYAHLVVHCGKCNSKYVLEKDVKDGIQVNMPTASNSELVLVCKECKNTMALYFVESDGASKKVDAEPTTEINIEENNGIVAVDSEIVETKMEVVE